MYQTRQRDTRQVRQHKIRMQHMYRAWLKYVISDLFVNNDWIDTVQLRPFVLVHREFRPDTFHLGCGLGLGLGLLGPRRTIEALGTGHSNECTHIFCVSLRVLELHMGEDHVSVKSDLLKGSKIPGNKGLVRRTGASLPRQPFLPWSIERYSPEISNSHMVAEAGQPGRSGLGCSLKMRRVYLPARIVERAPRYTQVGPGCYRRKRQAGATCACDEGMLRGAACHRLRGQDPKRYRRRRVPAPGLTLRLRPTATKYCDHDPAGPDAEHAAGVGRARVGTYEDGRLTGPAEDYRDRDCSFSLKSRCKKPRTIIERRSPEQWLRENPEMARRGRHYVQPPPGQSLAS
ncbi:hypothetical protein K438DRAFT_1789761 [Mycena galopus ATCC 62051]|nr:hypothetical protein K438DRAFT_1789761 [Mycena galopus ATCC 62051]